MNHTSDVTESKIVAPSREEGVRSYWKVGAPWIGAVAIVTLARALAAHDAGLHAAAGIAMLTFAVLGAYIGYKKGIDGPASVGFTRLYAMMGALTVGAVILGVELGLGVVETSALAAASGVAMYVGFGPG